MKNTLLAFTALVLSSCGGNDSKSTFSVQNTDETKTIAQHPEIAQQIEMPKSGYIVDKINPQVFPSLANPLDDIAEYSVINDRTGFKGNNFPNIIGIIVKRVELKNKIAQYNYYSGVRYLKGMKIIKTESPSEDISQTSITTINFENSSEVSFLGLKFGSERKEAYELVTDCMRRVSTLNDSIDFQAAYDKVKDDIEFRQHPERFGIVFSAELFKYSTRMGTLLTTSKKGTVSIPLGGSLFEVGGNSYKSSDSKSLKNEYRILVGVFPLKP